MSIGEKMKQLIRMASTSLPSDLSIYILEPVYTMFKIALFAFRPEGTKLCIGSGTIGVREQGYTQGLQRWAKGESRYDILSLYKPICYGIEFIKIRDPEMAREIFQFVHRGLQQLVECYSNDNGIMTYLLEYVKLIQDELLDRSKCGESNLILENRCYYPQSVNDTFIQQLWSIDELCYYLDQLKVIRKADVFVNKKYASEVRQRQVEVMDIILSEQSNKFLKLLKNGPILYSK